MQIPIELFFGFVGVFFAFFILGLVTKRPVFSIITGVFLLSLTLTTTIMTLNSFSNGDTDAINEYDVTSSSGQVLINSVTAHSRGERLSNTASQITDKTIDCITVYLGRSGSPPNTTLIRVGVMDTSTVMVKEFGSMNVTALLTSAVQPYQFCLPIGTTYTFTDTETWGIKWNSGDATNTLTTRIDANNPFDGSNTEHVHATASTWIANAGQDIMSIITLRGTEGEIIHDEFEFTEFHKTIFALFSAILMLVGAILWRSEQTGDYPFDY